MKAPLPTAMAETLPPDRPGRRMIDGTLWILSAELLLFPTGLVTAAFLTRKLGPHGYGLFTLSASLVAWIEWTVSSLFSRGAVKFVGEAGDWRAVGRTVARLYLCAGAAAALALMFLAPAMARLFGEPALSGYLRLFALDIPLFTLAHAFRSVLVGIGRFRPRALGTAGRWAVRLAVIVILVELGFSVTGAILGSMAASFAEAALGYGFTRLRFWAGTGFPWRPICEFSAPIFLFAASLRLYERLDLFSLKALGAPASAAGVYGAAQNLSLMPAVVAMSFSPLLLSTLTRLRAAGDEAAAKRMASHAMRIAFYLLPFAALAAGASAPIVSTVFGPAFEEAGPLLSILIFGAAASFMISAATAMLTAIGRPGWTLALAGPIVPVALAGHLVLIPRFGARGAAAATTGAALLCAAASMAAVRRLWGVRPPWTTLARSLLIAAAAYPAARGWTGRGLAAFLAPAAIAAAVPLLLCVMGEFSRDELTKLRGLVTSHG